MIRFLVIFCAFLLVGACEPDKAQARFDVIPAEVDFWSERQGSLMIQLDGAGSVRLERVMRAHKDETIEFYIGDVLVVSPIARAPVDTGNLVFKLDDATRIKVEPLLPSALRRD